MRVRQLSSSTRATVAWSGLTGGLWGLALARALAETFPASPTFDLLPSVVLALALAGLAGLVAWWRRPEPSTFVPLCLAGIYLFWPGVAPRVGWTLLGGGLALAALLAAERAAALPYLLAGTSLAFYLRTLGPTVGEADTFEFQVVAPTLGVAHPTGYPLYILSGKLFSLLPLGSVAWRVNLTSAVFATGAALMVYFLVRRLGPRTAHPPGRVATMSLVPLLAALALAFSRVFWSQAVVAEVYALHNLFVGAILLLLVRGLIDGETSARWLYGLALLLGLSFANHLTTALLLPAVGLTLILLRPRLNGRTWLIAGGCLALGLSLYLYIYFRWPTLHDGTWMSWGEFWRYVTGQQFGGALRLEAWRSDPTRYEIVGRLLREPFGWPGLILGALGLAWLAVKRRRVALVSGVTFLAYGWYALSYYVPDVSVFLLPAHLVLATWLGVGAAALAVGVQRVVRDRGKWHTGVPLAVTISLLALLPLGLLWTNLPRVDQSDARAAYRWGERVLDLPLERDAAILADSARIAPLYYLQRVQGRRPDLDMLVLADEGLYRQTLEARLAGGQTVYLARYLPGLEGIYHLQSLGPLTEVRTAPVPQPPPLDRTLDARFSLPDGTDAGVELLGLTDPVPGPGGGVGLTLFWRSEEQIGQIYHVRLRVVDDEGRVWWQTDGRHPVDNYYPTPAWRPDELIVDYHELPPRALDPPDVPEMYAVQAGLFPPFGEGGLTTASGNEWTTLTRLDEMLAGFDVERAKEPLHPLRARLGEGRTLIGADLAEGTMAGAPVEVDLYWQTEGATAPLQPTFSWVDPQDAEIEARLTERWGDERFVLVAPPSPGDYRLRLTLLDGQQRPLPARCGWLARASDGCVLASVRVTDAATSALANFDGKMALVEAEIGASILQAGQALGVTLRWQGLRSMEQNYTVSVQLVGPDGRLYGQTDAWPVQGTLPTGQWSPGQRVIDPYRVTLNPQAPPGRYRVGVAVYLLATRTRLPVLDAAGRTIGDIAWLGEIRVDGSP